MKPTFTYRELPPIVELIADLEDFFYRQLGPAWKCKLPGSNASNFASRSSTVLRYYPEAVRRGFLRRNSNGIERIWRARLDRAVQILMCAELAGVNIALGEVLHWLVLSKSMKTRDRDDVQPLSHNDLRPCFMRTPNPCKAIDAALAVPIVARRNPPVKTLNDWGAFPRVISLGHFSQHQKDARAENYEI